MRLCIACLIALFLVSANATGRADDLDIRSVPPVVVKSIPQAGATDVDAGLTEIKVTFSKDMYDDSWSWSTVTRESFPKTTGPSKYENDKRTCVLPVKLAPGKTYGIWLNSAKFKNFKDTDEVPALPYLLVFQTKKK